MDENLEKLKTEQDEGVRASLEKSNTRVRYTMAEMANFKPRYADMTFEGSVSFQGSTRFAEFRSLGPGHSGDDAVLLLPEDGVMFIGDIIFANEQPFMGFCDLALWREQLDFLLASDYQTFVPGHGSICGKKEIKLQSNYFDVMENLIQEVVQRGDPFEEALKIELPPPFDGWLFGSTGRFESNVRMLFEYLGGRLPKTE